jgi:hypothetical protein
MRCEFSRSDLDLGLDTAMKQHRQTLRAIFARFFLTLDAAHRIKIHARPTSIDG